MEAEHKPVLLTEVLEYINLKENSLYVDGTCGNGGHLSAMLKKAPSSVRFIGIDKDPDAVKRLEQKFLENQNVKIACSDYVDMDNVLSFFDIKKVDGILIDLGFSSLQIGDPERGFCFRENGPLDMRYNRNQSLTAEQVVNDYDARELNRIIRDYGEESFHWFIVTEILKAREQKRITTTKELQKIIHTAVIHKIRGKIKIDPATKTFQALRIEVNTELSSLESGLHKMIDLLNPGGRLCAISFHSLEDRIVKTAIQQYVERCTCPRGLPQCVCGNKPIMKWIVKSPLTATETELMDNSRSRSAKLRVAEKI